MKNTHNGKANKKTSKTQAPKVKAQKKPKFKPEFYKDRHHIGRRSAAMGRIFSYKENDVAIIFPDHLLTAQAAEAKQQSSPKSNSQNVKVNKTENDNKEIVASCSASATSSPTKTDKGSGAKKKTESVVKKRKSGNEADLSEPPVKQSKVVKKSSTSASKPDTKPTGQKFTKLKDAKKVNKACGEEGSTAGKTKKTVPGKSPDVPDTKSSKKTAKDKDKLDSPKKKTPAKVKDKVANSTEKMESKKSKAKDCESSENKGKKCSDSSKVGTPKSASKTKPDLSKGSKTKGATEKSVTSKKGEETNSVPKIKQEKPDQVLPKTKKVDNKTKSQATSTMNDSTKNKSNSKASKTESIDKEESKTSTKKADKTDKKAECRKSKEDTSRKVADKVTKATKQEQPKSSSSHNKSKSHLKHKTSKKSAILPRAPRIRRTACLNAGAINSLILETDMAPKSKIPEPSEESDSDSSMDSDIRRAIELSLQTVNMPGGSHKSTAENSSRKTAKSIPKVIDRKDKRKSVEVKKKVQKVSPMKKSSPKKKPIKVEKLSSGSEADESETEEEEETPKIQKNKSKPVKRKVLPAPVAAPVKRMASLNASAMLAASSEPDIRVKIETTKAARAEVFQTKTRQCKKNSESNDDSQCTGFWVAGQGEEYLSGGVKRPPVDKEAPRSRSPSPDIQIVELRPQTKSPERADVAETKKSKKPSQEVSPSQQRPPGCAPAAPDASANTPSGPKSPAYPLQSLQQMQDRVMYPEGQACTRPPVPPMVRAPQMAPSTTSYQARPAYPPYQPHQAGFQTQMSPYPGHQVPPYIPNRPILDPSVTVQTQHQSMSSTSTPVISSLPQRPTPHPPAPYPPIPQSPIKATVEPTQQYNMASGQYNMNAMNMMYQRPRAPPYAHQHLMPSYKGFAPDSAANMYPPSPQNYPGVQPPIQYRGSTVQTSTTSSHASGSHNKASNSNQDNYMQQMGSYSGGSNNNSNSSQQDYDDSNFDYKKYGNSSSTTPFSHAHKSAPMGNTCTYPYPHSNQQPATHCQTYPVSNLSSVNSYHPTGCHRQFGHGHSAFALPLYQQPGQAPDMPYNPGFYQAQGPMMQSLTSDTCYPVTGTPQPLGVQGIHQPQVKVLVHNREAMANNPLPIPAMLPHSMPKFYNDDRRIRSVPPMELTGRGVLDIPAHKGPKTILVRESSPSKTVKNERDSGEKIILDLSNRVPQSIKTSAKTDKTETKSTSHDKKNEKVTKPSNQQQKKEEPKQKSESKKKEADKPVERKTYPKRENRTLSNAAYEEIVRKASVEKKLGIKQEDKPPERSSPGGTKTPGKRDDRRRSLEDRRKSTEERRRSLEKKASVKKEDRQDDKKSSNKKEDKNGANKKLASLKAFACSWHWEGEPEMKFIPLVGEGPASMQPCYSAIRHDDGDIIRIRDCVLIKSGHRKRDIPFVAKISAFWERGEGEMMMSVLWFYRPEHTDTDRLPRSVESEVYASKHKDEVNVACIEDKCYVLTFNQFSRYRAELVRHRQGLPSRPSIVPERPASSMPSTLPVMSVDPRNVFLCRRVYDIKLKRVLKNPTITSPPTKSPCGPVTRSGKSPISTPQAGDCPLPGPSTGYVKPFNLDPAKLGESRASVNCASSQVSKPSSLQLSTGKTDAHTGSSRKTNKEFNTNNSNASSTSSSPDAKNSLVQMNIVVDERSNKITRMNLQVDTTSGKIIIVSTDETEKKQRKRKSALVKASNEGPCEKKKTKDVDVTPKDDVIEVIDISSDASKEAENVLSGSDVEIIVDSDNDTHFVPTTDLAKPTDSNTESQVSENTVVTQTDEVVSEQISNNTDTKVTRTNEAFPEQLSDDRDTAVTQKINEVVPEQISENRGTVVTQTDEVLTEKVAVNEEEKTTTAKSDCEMPSETVYVSSSETRKGEENDVDMECSVESEKVGEIIVTETEDEVQASVETLLQDKAKSPILIEPQVADAELPTVNNVITVEAVVHNTEQSMEVAEEQMSDIPNDTTCECYSPVGASDAQQDEQTNKRDERDSLMETSEHKEDDTISATVDGDAEKVKEVLVEKPSNEKTDEVTPVSAIQERIVPDANEAITEIMEEILEKVVSETESITTDSIIATQETTEVEKSDPIVGQESESSSVGISSADEPIALKETIVSKDVAMETTVSKDVAMETTVSKDVAMETIVSNDVATVQENETTSSSETPPPTEPMTSDEVATETSAPKDVVTESTSPKEVDTGSTSPTEDATETTAPKEENTESTASKEVDTESTTPKEVDPPQQETTAKSTPRESPSDDLFFDQDNGTYVQDIIARLDVDLSAGNDSSDNIISLPMDQSNLSSQVDLTLCDSTSPSGILATDSTTPPGILGTNGSSLEPGTELGVIEMVANGEESDASTDDETSLKRASDDDDSSPAAKVAKSSAESPKPKSLSLLQIVGNLSAKLTQKDEPGKVEHTVESKSDSILENTVQSKIDATLENTVQSKSDANLENTVQSKSDATFGASDDPTPEGGKTTCGEGGSCNGEENTVSQDV